MSDGGGGMRLAGGNRVVVITPDRVGPVHAGIALRHLGLARALARRGWDVTLASTDPESEWGQDDFRFTTVGPRSVRALVGGARACIVQGTVLKALPLLKTLDVPLVVDLICPIFLENLERYRGRLDGEARVGTDYDLFHEALAAGDAFLCGSEAQRHFWLGMLAGAGRVTIAATDLDRDLSRLVRVVPFGVPEEAPRRTGAALRGVVDGVGDDDLVLYWGGGLWNWLDPLTPIRAVAELAPRRPELKLVFSGLVRPQDSHGMTDMARRALDLAGTLGVLDRHVFFLQGWAPAERMGDFVLESDIGISAHHDSLETMFAVRTRVWTYLWGGLPMIVSAGDWAAGLVAEHGLGNVVAADDTAGWVAALDRLADPAERMRCAAASRAVAAGRSWDAASTPLADLLAGPLAARSAKARTPRGSRPVPVLSHAVLNVRKFRAAVHADGLPEALRRSWGKLSRRTLRGVEGETS